jgi:hypothetical protein
MGLLAGAGCWLAVGQPVRLRARYSRTAPNVANQPQPLLRSEVQARWRSAIAADGPAVQMDGPPVPASNSRAAAAAACHDRVTSWDPVLDLINCTFYSYTFTTAKR